MPHPQPTRHLHHHASPPSPTGIRARHHQCPIRQYRPRLLADLYAVLADNEIFLVNEAVRSMRDSAWRLATLLTLEPGFARPATIWARDRQVAGQVEVTFDPPALTGLIQTIIAAIAARESRDIVKNIQVLDAIASTPAPIQTTL